MYEMLKIKQNGHILEWFTFPFWPDPYEMRRCIVGRKKKLPKTTNADLIRFIQSFGEEPAITEDHSIYKHNLSVLSTVWGYDP